MTGYEVPTNAYSPRISRESVRNRTLSFRTNEYRCAYVYPACKEAGNTKSGLRDRRNEIEILCLYNELLFNHPDVGDLPADDRYGIGPRDGCQHIERDRYKPE